MLNAEDIIELEKKWLIYKIKQKAILYGIFFGVILTISFITYLFFFNFKFEVPQIISKTIDKKVTEVKTLPKKQIIKKIKSPKIDNNITIKKEVSKNTITQPITKLNTTKSSKIKSNKKENSKPLSFKIRPNNQVNELFSTNGVLILNKPFENKSIKKDTKTYKKRSPIKNITKVKKKKISIDMQEINTITYLKEKFYSTSSIVFALMLAEEYYYEKNFKNSLKWSLTANDIDSQNTKSWYWFAKSKVKLGREKDAIKALKAYLSNNQSKRLTTLLHKIEQGDSDD